MSLSERKARTDRADRTKALIGPQYWPFALIVYPAVLSLTAGLGLWVIWTYQERKVGESSPDHSWTRPLGWALLCFVPLAYFFVAAGYSRDLYYVRQDAKLTGRPEKCPTCGDELTNGPAHKCRQIWKL